MILRTDISYEYGEYRLLGCDAVYSSEIARRFGETYHLLQNRRFRRLDTLLSFPSDSAAFLARLFFYPEDGGSVYLRNAGLSPNYTAVTKAFLFLLTITRTSSYYRILTMVYNFQKY
jgi:hypothetical protein